MLGYIHSHEKKLLLEQHGALGRFFLQLKLLGLYILFAFHRAMHLLFSSSTKSFVLVNEQDDNGKWSVSYETHIKFQHGLRFFSLASFLVIVTSVVMVFSVMQVIFPSQQTPIAYAYASTVTNADDSGAGSLRQAILDVNASADATNTITIDLSGAIPQTINLVTALPPITKPVTFTNNDGDLSLVVEGDALAANEACMTMSSGSGGSTLAGVSFQSCPTAIAVTTNNVTVGASGAGAIYMIGGTTGIDVLASVSNTTIQYAYAGRWKDNTGSGMTSAFKIQGSSNTISNVEGVNSTYGMEITGDSNTVTTSKFGINASDSDMGNITAGIYMTGDSNTIGGTAIASANYISYNDNWGIWIDGGATSNLVRINYIGYKSDGTTAAGNGQHGITIRTASNGNTIGNASPVQAPIIGNNAQNGIDIRNSSNITINSVQIDNSTSHGVYLTSASNIDFNNVSVTDSGQEGIAYYDNSYGDVTSSMITGSALNGISYGAGGAFTFDGNTISNNTQNGLSGYNSNAVVTITDNTIQSNGADGIAQNISTAAVTITGNTVNSNGGQGMQINDISAAYTISNNTVNTNGNHGISLFGVSTGIATMSDNTINSTVTGNGLFLGADFPGTITVSGNVINQSSGPAVYGFSLPATANITIDDNDFDGSAGTNANGIYFQGENTNDPMTTAITISNNTITGMGANGITLTDVDGAVIDSNTITNSAVDALIYLLRNDNVVIQNNTLQKTGSYYRVRDCIVAAGGDGAVITGNTIQGCYSGIQITQNITDAEIGGSVPLRNTFIDNQVALSINNDNGYADTERVLVTYNTFEDNGATISLSTQNNAPTLPNDAVVAPTLATPDTTVSAITGTGGYSGGIVQVYASLDGTDLYYFAEGTPAADGTFTIIDDTYDFTVLTAELNVTQIAELDGYSLIALNIDSSNNTSTFGLAVVIDYVAPVDDNGDDDNGNGGDNGDDGVDFDIATAISQQKTKLVFTVTTGVESTATLEYGTTNDLGAALTDDVPGTTHTFTITSLEPNTTYYYKVTVTDADGVNEESTDVDSTKTLSEDAIQETLTADYLDEQVTVNGQMVTDKNTVLYLDPSQVVDIVIAQANNNHQVRLRMLDAENDNAELDKTEWKNVQNNEVEFAVKGLPKNKVISVDAKARKDADRLIQSKEQRIAKVYRSRKAPAFTAFTGDYAVTTRPQAMTFQAAVGDVRFRFQDRNTGKFVGQCEVDDTLTCVLPFALSVGEFNVYQETVKNDIPSAPAIRQLYVTQPISVKVFNTDHNNDRYYQRLTTESSVVVVGLGPQDAEARVYFDGELAGEATYSSAVGWSYTLDLSAATYADHLIEIKFVDPDTQTRVSAPIVYPFKYALPVTTPAIEQPADLYEQTAAFDLQVIGDPGASLFVFHDDELVFGGEFDAAGQATIPVITDSLGAQTLAAYAQDDLDIKSDVVTVSYDVVASIEQTATTGDTGGTDTGSTGTDTDTGTGADTGTDASTDTGGTDTNTDTGNAGTPDNTDSNSNTNSNTGNTNTNGNSNTNDNGFTDTTNNGGNGPGISGDPIGPGVYGEVPAPYNSSLTNPAEQEQLKSVLNEKLNGFSIGSSTEVYDKNGKIKKSSKIEKGKDGVTTLHKYRFIGLPSVVFPGSETVIADVLQIDGTSEPYALITLTIYSDPIVKVTRADGDGKWTMTVPVDAIPEGEHTAYLQTTSRDVTSDQIEIAKFVVVEERRLSNTTWIFIINIGLTIIVLLVAIALQLRHKRTAVETAVAAHAPAIIEMPHVAAQPKKKSDDNDDDTPDLHSALGV